jgi:hypothetical protein
MDTAIGPVSSAPQRIFEVRALARPLLVKVGGDGRDEFAEHLLRAWAGCEVVELDPTAAPDGLERATEVVLDSDPLIVRAARLRQAVAGDDPVLLSAQFTSTLTLRAIDERRGTLTMVHAAALEDLPTGRVAMLVGASGAGKTTAARVLGATMGYVTDETAAVSVTGEVIAYPKPLSLVPATHVRGPKRQVSPHELGLCPSAGPLRLALIVILARSSSAPTPPDVHDLSLLETMSELAQQSSHLTDFDRPLHRLASMVELADRAVRVEYNDAEHLPTVISQLLANRRKVRAPLRPAPSMPAAIGASGPAVSLAPLKDLYIDESGAAALRLDGDIIVVSELAGFILQATQTEPQTIAALVEQLTAEFGEPPAESGTSAKTRTEEILDSLVEQGLLERIDLPVP